MVTQSGGGVNRLLDRRLVQRFPAIDAAHCDLPRGRQGPEQHDCRIGVGQRAFRAQELSKKLDGEARGGGNTAMSGLILCPQLLRIESELWPAVPWYDRVRNW